MRLWQQQLELLWNGVIPSTPTNPHILFELSLEEIRGAKVHLNRENVDFCVMVGHIKVDTVHHRSRPCQWRVQSQAAAVGRWIS